MRPQANAPAWGVDRAPPQRAALPPHPQRPCKPRPARILEAGPGLARRLPCTCIRPPSPHACSPPPAPPQNIAPTALEQQRVSGDKNITPDDVTRTEIQRSGKTQLMVPVKVCIDRAGNIASVKIMKSSGFPAYDQKLTREISKWRYRPFSVNGTPTPVCSAIQFIYRQK